MYFMLITNTFKFSSIVQLLYNYVIGKKLWNNFGIIGTYVTGICFCIICRQLHICISLVLDSVSKHIHLF